MNRILIALVALAFQTANAQVQTTPVPPALEVQRLAPQLIAFAGSDVNFTNLVNGLALGVPVTLTTPLATGGLQVFSFTPTGALTAVQIAQLLESARQSLIGRGIATPTAQQLGTTLTGGTLVTTTTTPAVTAPTVTTQSPAASIQGANAAAGSTVRNMSDSPLPRGISDTPPAAVPGATAPVQPSLEAPRVAPTLPAFAAPAVRAADR